jgi:hypothetical protein
MKFFLFHLDLSTIAKRFCLDSLLESITGSILTLARVATSSRTKVNTVNDDIAVRTH